jgi:hypothetical protein
MILAVISSEGPEALYFCFDNINGEFYQAILQKCLPDIKKLYE